MTVVPQETELDFAVAAEATLRDLRERVGLDSWWISRRIGDDHVVLAALDDVFGRHEGAVSPWADSLCRRMLDDGAPAIAARLADVPAYVEALASQGAQASSALVLPITSPTGVVLATLCALGREEAPGFEEALPTVVLQARMLGALLSHELRLADGPSAPRRPR